MRPVFADPKTDVVFKKIFGQPAHKGLLIELLDALLELDDAHRILDLEYLSLEQLPPRRDLKLSMLDVKCLDAQGTRYVVEMQVIEVEGFQKRVVYNACKAYSTQLAVGADYPELNDVVAVTICNFVLWNGKDEGGAHRVPMLSRWHMREEHSGERGLGQIRYAFLELPKYGAADHPETTVDKWAYFFRSALSLTRVPDELAEGPWAEALEVARTANLSPEEWTEYEREKMAEQDFRGGLSLAEKRGEQRGEERGFERGLEQGTLEARAAFLDLCDAFGIELTEARRAQLDGLDLAGLSDLRKRLVAARAWPSG
jgi:predicted transposase/invertase (TIGR01784 family)